MDIDHTFVSSDLHLYHSNILKFISQVDNKSRVRPVFGEDDILAMNEAIVANHNSVVGPDDTWYCLGDVIFGINKIDNILPRLNGRKKYLILGNHEYREKSDFMHYFDYFKKISESARIGNVVFTHRPVLLGGWESYLKANVHGHIHEVNVPDPRYFNASMEQINYTPVSLRTIRDTLRGREVNADYDYEKPSGVEAPAA